MLNLAIVRAAQRTLYTFRDLSKDVWSEMSLVCGAVSVAQAENLDRKKKKIEETHLELQAQ